MSVLLVTISAFRQSNGDAVILATISALSTDFGVSASGYVETQI